MAAAGFAVVSVLTAAAAAVAAAGAFSLNRKVFGCWRIFLFRRRFLGACKTRRSESYPIAGTCGFSSENFLSLKSSEFLFRCVSLSSVCCRVAGGRDKKEGTIWNCGEGRVGPTAEEKVGIKAKQWGPRGYFL